jgi:hypothetical protein
MTMTKAWYESKTLWFNVFALLSVVIGSLTQWPELVAIYPQLTAAFSIVNMILRFMTYEALGDGSTKS